MKVVHLMVLDKFIPPFIKFINDHFNPEEHLFIIFGRPKTDYGMDIKVKNVFWLDSKWKIFDLLKFLYNANKIIIHGLWVEKLNQLLFIQPWLLKKCYWVMWGGDFYFPQKQSKIKKELIKKIRHVVTYIDGDVDYIKENYGANPVYHKCFMYLSNIFDENRYQKCEKINKNELWILIGNSADETNRHEFVFSKLKKIKNEKIKLIVPLSYSGGEEYKSKVIEIGKKEFGERFVPLTKFLSYEEYLNILYNVDIAIFAHNRQQGMGNTIQLLGLGKKVYLNRDTSQWRLFEDLGIKVYDVNGEIDLSINNEELENNKKIIKEYFSYENLKLQWDGIFYG